MPSTARGPFLNSRTSCSASIGFTGRSLPDACHCQLSMMSSIIRVVADDVAREAQKLFFEIGMEHRRRVGAALNELGLTFSQAHALRILEAEGPLTMSALAERL